MKIPEICRIAYNEVNWPGRVLVLFIFAILAQLSN